MRARSQRLAKADDKKTASLATQINARAASSLQELAETSSSIITMLPNTPSVEAVYLGKSACILPGNVSNAFSAKTTTTTATMAAAMKEHVRTDEVVTGGILDWVQPGTLLVDSSTIDALASRRLNLIAMQKVKWERVRRMTRTRRDTTCFFCCFCLS